MLAEHPDYVVAIDWNMRVGDLVVDYVVEAILLAAQALIIEGTVDHEIIVDPADQAVFGERTDTLLVTPGQRLPAQGHRSPRQRQQSAQGARGSNQRPGEWRRNQQRSAR